MMNDDPYRAQNVYHKIHQKYYYYFHRRIVVVIVRFVHSKRLISDWFVAFCHFHSTRTISAIPVKSIQANCFFFLNEKK